mmetsp:Transcript_3925/g.7482  ORF Transcript_3925/g.7482 Transcript_3925/m.7482 type:complete len:163 (-) Transcript_3925:80-568(-)
MTINDIPEDLLLDCCALVKANSIVGCKRNSVYVIYTYWKNLKKTADMVDGQVSYHRPQNVRRCEVEKHNSIVNQLKKTKEERHPNLYEEQQAYMRKVRETAKERHRAEEKEKKRMAEEARKKREAHEKIFSVENIKIADDYDDEDDDESEGEVEGGDFDAFF